MTNNSDWQKWT